MGSEKIKTLDRCIEEILAPFLSDNGFSREKIPYRKRLFVRRRDDEIGWDVIEVDLGKSMMGGCFRVNLRIQSLHPREVHQIRNDPEKSFDEVDSRAKHRQLGDFPISLLRLPQIILFRDLGSLLIPVFWLTLIADSWWRYLSWKPYTSLAILDVKYLLKFSGLPWFARFKKFRENPRRPQSAKAPPDKV